MRWLLAWCPWHARWVGAALPGCGALLGVLLQQRT